MVIKPEKFTFVENNIDFLTEIYFSPTGSTKKIINAIKKGMSVSTTKTFDLTNPKIRNSTDIHIKNGLTLIGVPVYEKRIPEIILPFLKKMQADNLPIVLVAVFGNVSVGKTLNQLELLVEKRGFHVIGAATFVGKNVLSTEKIPIAHHRPTSKDLKIAEDFGIKVINKMMHFKYIEDIPKPNLPKKSIYFSMLMPSMPKRITFQPVVNLNKCNHCGICIKTCTAAAIDPLSLKINEKKCIRCFRCVVKCPSKARQIDLKKKWLVTKFLKRQSKKINNPQIYL